MSATNGRQNQKERGLSVEQSKIRPKLTPEQRKTMTDEEKREYSAARLKEYRKQYGELYAVNVFQVETRKLKTERAIAYKFYKEFMANQVATSV